MSKVYNQEQQEFIRTARQAYVEHVAEIDRQKEYVKETFESLIDKLGIDPKEDKESVKALKKGFALYYKNTKDEEQRVIDGAIEIAGL